MNNAFFSGNVWSIELGYLFLHIKAVETDRFDTVTIRLKFITTSI